MMAHVPTLFASVIPALADREAQAHVRCGWCEDVHIHSPSPGYRVAHCTRKESPYRKTGYALSLRCEVLALANPAPEALFAGRQHLWSTIENAAAGLRAALLRSTLGTRVGRHFDKRVGRARISVCGNAWSVDLDAFPSNAELCASQPQRRPMRLGRDFITLLATLYGVPLGIVGLRLLEAVSSASFDAKGRCAIAAEIEAAYARKAGSKGEQR